MQDAWNVALAEWYAKIKELLNGHIHEVPLAWLFEMVKFIRYYKYILA